ncbi:MAG: hypothetical protein K0S07_916 [Chlamydiales bacterium]|jgi:hypothetical protein|nr:hypothetical protein [Chlamydiales bacterium]
MRLIILLSLFTFSPLSGASPFTLSAKACAVGEPILLTIQLEEGASAEAWLQKLQQGKQNQARPLHIELLNPAEKTTAPPASCQFLLIAEEAGAQAIHLPGDLEEEWIAFLALPPRELTAQFELPPLIEMSEGAPSPSPAPFFILPLLLLLPLFAYLKRKPLAQLAKRKMKPAAKGIALYTELNAIVCSLLFKKYKMAGNQTSEEALLQMADEAPLELYRPFQEFFSLVDMAKFSGRLPSKEQGERIEALAQQLIDQLSRRP